MTVKDLIKKLQAMPQDAIALIPNSGDMGPLWQRITEVYPDNEGKQSLVKLDYLFRDEIV